MNTVTTDGFKAKRPLVIYLLAVCFMAAPIGNTVMSMIGAGVTDWYTPGAVLQWLSRMPLMVYLWIGLSFIAGFFLLIPRKWSWFLSILAIAFSIGMSIYTKAKYQSHYFSLTSIGNLGVLVVIYHFRFPYLDRREWWWGTARRYRCDLPIRMGAWGAKITNISRSGAFIAANSGAGEPAFLDYAPGATIEFEIPSLPRLQAVVARTAADGLGVQFRMDSAQTRAVKAFVRNISARG